MATDIITLLQKYKNETISNAEWLQLREAIISDKYKTLINEDIFQQLQQSASAAGWTKEAEDAILAAILTGKPEQKAGLYVHRVHFLRTAWFRYAAAIILLAGIGAYYLFTTLHNPSLVIPEGNLTGVSPTKEKANKPILTLASGKKIELDANQAYNAGADVFGEAKPVRADEANETYNTITTPKGIQYQVVLPDGTKAWLNAASSIKFPTTFTSKQRRVEATGEIYFETSVNKTTPFVVSSKGMEVQVLGTTFNVKAYEDETTVKTSLVEGAVKVNNQLLTPGQAYLNGKVVTTNLDQDIAWKNGLFNFEGLNIQEVMNQLQRWYNIEVEYESGIPDVKFLGGFSKNVKLPVILEALNGFGIHFKVEGNKVIVMP